MAARGAPELRNDSSLGGVASQSFVLYVEGPLDRDVLRGWSYRLAPRAIGELIERSVILGGRQPERALQHFRERAKVEPRLRGLCLLDRDDGAGPTLPAGEPRLEFFTWGRRHIESYLLVGGAMRRCVRARQERRGLERFLRELPTGAGEEDALRTVDAKRLLSADGPLARALGRPLRPGRIARAMTAGEFHDDVLELFRRLRAALPASESH